MLLIGTGHANFQIMSMAGHILSVELPSASDGHGLITGPACLDRVSGAALYSYGSCPTSNCQLYRAFLHVTSRAIASSGPLPLSSKVFCKDPVLSPTIRIVFPLHILPTG